MPTLETIIALGSNPHDPSLNPVDALVERLEDNEGADATHELPSHVNTRLAHNVWRFELTDFLAAIEAIRRDLTDATLEPMAIVEVSQTGGRQLRTLVDDRVICACSGMACAISTCREQIGDANDDLDLPPTPRSNRGFLPTLRRICMTQGEASIRASVFNDDSDPDAIISALKKRLSDQE